MTYDVPLLKLPMGRDRSGRAVPPITNKALKERADAIVAGERCLHCNREIIDIENTVLARKEGASQVRLHTWCVMPFIRSGPVDWLNRDTTPTNHIFQSGDGDRIYVQVDNERPQKIKQRGAALWH